MEAKQRLRSLDFFRGITVAAMILVNNPGSWGHIYAPLEHAEWNGCTPTDLVFPFFLFIVGVSIAYAMSSQKMVEKNHPELIKKAAKRSLILFGLGLFLSIYGKLFTAPLEGLLTIRIPGVLQRISVVFFISTLIFLKQSERAIFRSLVMILLAYWAIMTFVPVPDVGYANLEKETNLGAWIDRNILTEAHLWKSSKTWDPEGILSTLPAVATGLFGILVGLYLKRKDVDEAKKVAWLFSIGIFATFLGLLWDLQFPINKSLWTSSYVLYTGGLATLVLTLCYWIIDINQNYRFTAPFVAFGSNAITVFFLSGLMPRTLNWIKIGSEGNELGLLSWIYQKAFVPYFSPVNASLAYAIAFVLFWFVILWFMYKRNIIIKV